MNIKTHKIQNTWKKALPESERLKWGWGNGYIGVPPEHPWYGKHYYEVNENISVHGGLTYSDKCAPLQEPDGYWWLGFDTAHLDDTEQNCPESYVDAEIESLKKQALEVVGIKA